MDPSTIQFIDHVLAMALGVTFLWGLTTVIEHLFIEKVEHHRLVNVILMLLLEMVTAVVLSFYAIPSGGQ